VGFLFGVQAQPSQQTIMPDCLSLLFLKKKKKFNENKLYMHNQLIKGLNAKIVHVLFNVYQISL
jgi:hypothetical protein